MNLLIAARDMAITAASDEPPALDADGRPIPYAWWVGETFMEVAVRAFFAGVPITIELRHDVGPEDREVVRKAILPPEPEPEPAPEPTPEP